MIVDVSVLEELSKSLYLLSCFVSFFSLIFALLLFFIVHFHRGYHLFIESSGRTICEQL